MASKSLSIAGVDLINNRADVSGSVLYLDNIEQTSIISDASFIGNNGVTIQSINSPIDWDCRLGSWMPTEGAIKGDFNAPECYRCPAGYYGNTSDLTTSFCSGQCIRGHFCKEGTADPEPCPPGRYSPVIGAPSQEFCLPCAPGQYQPLSAQADCLTCPAGSFSPDVGLAACDPCPRGGYCEEAGAATRMVWEPCPAGSFNPANGSNSSAACKLCPAGTASATRGAESSDTCAPCRPGTVAATAGLPECDSCPPGTSSGRGSDSCDACEAGSYAANAGQGLCVPCPHPLSSVSGSTTCSFCMDDYYLRNTSANPGDILTSPTEYCKPCPPNAACPDNTTLSSLVLPHGFWRASPSSAVLTECRIFGGDAEAGETRCAGSEPVAGEASRRRRMVEAGSDAYCASDFKGPECQLCAAPDHHLVDGDRCKQCLAVRTAAGQITALAIGICVVCGLAWAAFKMESWRKKPCIGPLLRLADRAVTFSAAISLIPKLKILLGFYQICIVLSTTYSVRLPERYTSWTDKVNEAVSIDWSGFFLPTQCLPYWSRLVAVSISPVGVIALLLLAGVGLRLHQRRLSPSPWATEAALGLLDLTPACLFLVFCFVPSVSAFIFRAWSCQAPRSSSY